MRNPFRRAEGLPALNVVEEVGRDPLRLPLDTPQGEAIAHTREIAASRKVLDKVLERRLVTDEEEPQPHLVLKPGIISTLVVIHANASDPRVETYVRGEDGQFSVESIVR